MNNAENIIATNTKIKDLYSDIYILAMRQLKVYQEEKLFDTAINSKIRKKMKKLNKLLRLGNTNATLQYNANSSKSFVLALNMLAITSNVYDAVGYKEFDKALEFSIKIKKINNKLNKYLRDAIKYEEEHKVDYTFPYDEDEDPFNTEDMFNIEGLYNDEHNSNGFETTVESETIENKVDTDSINNTDLDGVELKKKYKKLKKKYKKLEKIMLNNLNDKC